MPEMSGNSSKNQVTDKTSTTRGSDVGTEQSPTKKELSLFQFNRNDSSQGAAGGSGLTSVPPITTGSSQGPGHLILPPARGTAPPHQGSTEKSMTGLQHAVGLPRFDTFGTPAGSGLTGVPPTTTGSSQGHLISPARGTELPHQGSTGKSTTGLQQHVGPPRFTFGTPAGNGLTSVPPTTTGSSHGLGHLILPPARGTAPPHQGSTEKSTTGLQHAVGPPCFSFGTPAGIGLTSVPPPTNGSSQGPGQLILPTAIGTQPPLLGQGSGKRTTGLQHDVGSPHFTFGTPAGNVLTGVPPTTSGSSQGRGHLILPPVIGTQPPLFLGHGSGKWTPTHAMTQPGFTSSSPGNVTTRQHTPRPQGFTITPGSLAGCSRASAQAGSSTPHSEGRFRDRKGFNRSIFRITVTNLAAGVSMKELKEFFQQLVGNVLYADAHTPIRFQGLVEFTSYDSMMEALVYNGCSLGNQVIHIAQDTTSLGNPVLTARVNLFGHDSNFDSASEKEQVWTNPDGKRPSFGRTSMILVGGIPRMATIGQLAAHFQGVQLSNIRLIMKDDAVNRGYGYLSFIDDGGTASKALAMYKFKLDSGKVCSLSLNLISPKCTLLVSGMPVTVGDSDLLCRFNHLLGCERVVGNLPETKGKGHSNDGSCLVLFRTSEGAVDGGKSITGGMKKIVTWADPIEAKGDYASSNSSSLASAAKKMGIDDE